MLKILRLMLLCLILCGCAQSTPVASLTDSTGGSGQAQAAMTLRFGIPAHPLETPNVRQIYPLADGVLLVGDTLTALDSRFLTVGQFDGSQDFQFWQEGVACYLPENNRLVLLNHRLEEVTHITLPQETIGTPRISQDGQRLWYCTDNALRLWDLESGIRRRVSQLQQPLSLTGLIMDDTVLVCEDGESTRFLDAQTGATLRQLTGSVGITSREGTFFAALPQSTRTDYVFGTPEEIRTLLPQSLNDECIFLPAQTAALALHASDDTVSVEYYALTSGAFVDTFPIPEGCSLQSIAPLGENQVLLLIHDPENTCDVLLTWTISRTAPSTTCYTGPYYTRQNPDTVGLTGCQNYADQIASKYGISICVGEAAAAAAPWDYAFEPEHLERVLTENLKLLDQLLSHYPRQVLSQTAEHFGGLTVCLVRQIRGTAASGSLATATGVQYIRDGQSYLALAAGAYMEQALYHELFHAMETCVFAKSTAFDQWENLNPSGFAYDYDFSANAQRNAGIYLETGSRAFVDTYSMSYPKEDRARIFEYAMLPNNESLYQAEVMQKKLQTICTGLREAYDLEDGPYLWEQYLKS